MTSYRFKPNPSPAHLPSVHAFGKMDRYRLGFSVVVEYHGGQEFGKDLVFGEIDRFAQVSYHGLQAKYVHSISQSDSNDLIQDCREAFNNSFRHPNTGAQERISSFLVANAGSIAPNARTNFFNALNTPHGGHIRMLDGKGLLALDRWATVNQVESVAEYLSGLLLELRYNDRLIVGVRSAVKSYLENEETPLPIERLRIGATTNYLTRPFISTRIDIEVVNQYWHKVANLLNPALDSLMRFGSRTENRRILGGNVLIWADEIARLGQALELAMTTVLMQLGPLTGV